MLEEERNFISWFCTLEWVKLGILEPDDFTDLDSKEVRELQRRVGLFRSDAPPDFRIRMRQKGCDVDYRLCWVDVKRPWMERDTYNLNDHRYEVYKAVAKADECPLYLVFYGSANQIIGWAELEYTNPQFNYRQMKINKELPFDQEIQELMAERIQRSSQGL